MTAEDTVPIGRKESRSGGQSATAVCSIPALLAVLSVEVDPSQPKQAEPPEPGPYEEAWPTLQLPLLGVHHILNSPHKQIGIPDIPYSLN